MKRPALIVSFALVAGIACIYPLDGGRGSVGAGTPQANYDAQQLERLVLVEVNRMRGAGGLPSFHADSRLATAARAHSADLARSGYTGHTGSDGSSPADRVRRTGWRPRARAENVYQGTLYAYVTRTAETGRPMQVAYQWEPPERLARLAVDGWMHSAGHRANLLNPALDLAGVGVAFDAEHRWIVTLDMAAD